MKKKKWLIIIVVIILVVLLIPIPRYLKDGGTVIYTAVLYRISKVHRLSERSSTGYIEGTEIEILGKKIYSNVPEEENPVEEKISWDAITENGVNEELLWSQVNQSDLEIVASILQDTIEEELQEEKENPQLVLAEGWVRIFEKEGYHKVVAMGKRAIKPLYWILYKSENAGLYEYLCSQALSDIMKLDLQKENGETSWATSKEFLEQFNQEMLNRKPKDFTLLNQEKAEVRLSDFYGKPMVLVFWASWCSPCQEELPAIEAVYQKYQKDVHFLAINMTNWKDGSVEKEKDFLNEKGYHFPAYFDINGNAEKAYQIKSIPQIRFLGKDGEVYQTTRKVVTQEEITEVIEEMLQK